MNPMIMQITQINIIDQYCKLYDTIKDLKYSPIINSNRPMDKSIMLTRLEEIGIMNAQEFIDNMVAHGGLMAGSFVLQCLLDETYISSDVDLFFAKIEETTRDKFLPPINPFEQWLRKNYQIKGEPATYNIAGVINSRKYKLTETAIINIVIIDKETPKTLKQYVNRSFDLSFCCANYDGKIFSVDSLALQKIGYVKTLDHYKKRQSYHHKSDKKRYHQDNTYYPDIDKILPLRINKYTNRGYTIYCLDDVLKNSYVDQNTLVSWTSGVITITRGKTTNQQIMRKINYPIEEDNNKIESEVMEPPIKSLLNKQRDMSTQTEQPIEHNNTAKEINQSIEHGNNVTKKNRLVEHNEVLLTSFNANVKTYRLSNIKIQGKKSITTRVVKIYSMSRRVKSLIVYQSLR